MSTKKNMTSVKEIEIAEYNYPLPDERIAKYPLKERDSSKLLIYNKGEISEDRSSDRGILSRAGEPQRLRSYFSTDRELRMASPCRQFQQMEKRHPDTECKCSRQRDNTDSRAHQHSIINKFRTLQLGRRNNIRRTARKRRRTPHSTLP